jgi:hypothetical protein
MYKPREENKVPVGLKSEDIYDKLLYCSIDLLYLLL